jgi:NAD+ diphosphatase
VTAVNATAFVLLDGDRVWARRKDGTGQPDPLWRDDPADASAVREAAGVVAATAVTAVGVEGMQIPSGAEAFGLRALHDLVAADVFGAAARGHQLLHWRRTHRFCGCCGAATERHAVERAMRCPACGHLAFPRINPVVITRVTRGREILLARRASGANAFFSLVAGFVEAGETLEQAAEREVREEVGVRVRNLRYVASQPWPFPNNLMLGFAADYDGGEVRPDGEEIAEAGWFAPERLPALPGPISISRRLIDAHVAEHVRVGASRGTRA